MRRLILSSMLVILGNSAQAIQPCLTLKAHSCIRTIEGYTVRNYLSIWDGTYTRTFEGIIETYKRYSVIEKDANGNSSRLASGLMSNAEAQSVSQLMVSQNCIKIAAAQCYQSIQGVHSNEYDSTDLGSGETVWDLSHYHEVNAYVIDERAVGSQSEDTLRSGIGSFSEATDTLDLLREDANSKKN
jgi:hypothetical protein